MAKYSFARAAHGNLEEIEEYTLAIASRIAEAHGEMTREGTTWVRSRGGNTAAVLLCL
jgi:hypothetical protein